MAGFRTFATGEVLTAANVNDFLMGQSVMRFADADARTAALGADVVEGMLTYNLDTDQLEVFDGTNFVIAAPEPPAPPAGIGSNVVEKLLTATFSTFGTSFVDVTGLSATITPSAATSQVLVILAAGTQFGSGSTALYQITATSGGNILGVRSASSSASVFVVSTETGVRLHSPNTTSAVTYQVQLRGTAGGGTAVRTKEGSTLTLIEVAG